MELSNKVAVITGAASGIGLALATRFVQEGAKVVASDLNAEAGAREAAEIGARFVQADVGSEAGVAALIENVLAHEGQIDLFCSNAGLAVGGGPDTEDRLWDLSQRVNFMSHVWAARHLLPHMLERGEGYLLQTVSAAGLLTETHSAPYAVTKHEAMAFAEWLAITYGDRGIKVSALCPEWVNTPLIQNAPHLQGGALEPADIAQKVVEGLAREDFLIVTHPYTLKAFQNKAKDYDRWLNNFRGVKQRYDSERGDREAFPEKKER